MIFTRFLSVLENGEVVSLFNRLRPKPIFILKKDWLKFKNHSPNLFSRDVKSAFLEAGILIDKNFEDDNLFNELRKSSRSKTMSILYLILTKDCNFRCKQCFQDERHIFQQTRSQRLVMSKSVIDSALYQFLQHIGFSDVPAEDFQIQLYGGEPLLHWDGLTYAVERIIELKRNALLPEKTKIITVTNGSLITEKVARFFSEKKILVGLSLDGRESENDLYRRTKSGEGTFQKIIQGLKILQKYEIPTTLSVTITPAIVDQLPFFLEWCASELNCFNIGFNPIGGLSYNYVKDQMMREQYDLLLKKNLIKSYQTARRLGIYEDRVGRKAKDFADLTFVFADCGAVNNQLVVFPNGDVSHCHASERYNIGNVRDEKLNIFKSKHVLDWENNLPINLDQCCNYCPAISICGYGCQNNVVEMGKRLDCLDIQYCQWIKDLFNQLVWDLYKNVTENSNRKEL